MALPNTNSVLSKIERTNTFPICGFLYGGNSNTKEDATPFKIVLDNTFDIISVMKIPNNTTNKTATADIIDDIPSVTLPAKNIIAIVIRNGNLPLHGTNAFVRIEINLSLLELIILQPITPAALHPNPMHMVMTRW